jgi:hypothetical protein
MGFPRLRLPWSQGANNPAIQKGYEFHVADIDNVPDLHGNPADAQLVLFIGGNQFFVLPKLIAAFEQRHPGLRGHIFYETLPPGILRKQMASDSILTLGNLTLQAKPDVYEAGARVLQEMQQDGQVQDVVEYATNDLEIMVRAGNPKGIHSLNDLGRPDVRLSMPNSEWEGVAKQIAASLRKAGGDPLYKSVHEDKVKSGDTRLTEIHHRQTPMRVLSGQLDAESAKEKTQKILMWFQFHERGRSELDHRAATMKKSPAAEKLTTNQSGIRRTVVHNLLVFQRCRIQLTVAAYTRKPSAPETMERASSAA